MGGRSRGERGQADRLEALLELGDHAAARAEAARLLADPGSSEAARLAAREASARLAPERGAVLAGAAGVAVAAALAAWTLLR
jgi:hypothetical protein